MPAGETMRELTSLTATEKQMIDDNEWIISNISELESRYAGEYILVWKKQVVAHGYDPQELFEQARLAGQPREQLVLFAVPGFLEVPK